jgi:hypothetical protein
MISFYINIFPNISFYLLPRFIIIIYSGAAAAGGAAAGAGGGAPEIQEEMTR